MFKSRVKKYLWITLLFALLVVAILLGYSYAGTGFGDFQKPNSDFVRGKTLWDWMELLVIPIVLALGVSFLNSSERENERQIAEDRQREATFQTYLDRMADLLLKEKLLTTENKEVRDVARIWTLATLRGLDANRKGMLVLFLKEAKLITEQPIINLTRADLSRANLQGANLNGTNLSRVNLAKANLKGAQLNNVDLSYSNVDGADMTFAKLVKADLTQASMFQTNFKRAVLEKAILERVRSALANLISADLTGANLRVASMWGAKLKEANLTKANLTNANLSGANLSKANLYFAKLTGAKLTGVKLTGANLAEANLQYAEITKSQLVKAKSLTGTIMPEGNKHD